MKKTILMFIIMQYTVLHSFSQNKINGIVKNAEGDGVEFISVIALPSNAPKTILASTFTDENGKFQMPVNYNCDSLILKASSVEIEPTQITVANRTGNYEIIVENRAADLKEVVVKSKKVYSHGDTINYNVGSFLSQTDQTIADVLRKMPGITVSDAGQVAYQGKPIKNFYIEGLDLMKGHYGIATNNIDPNNIATVQVMENHQDIKALKGLRPEEQASINLRLKDGVKGVFNLIAAPGGGYGDKELWNNSAIATYFRRTSQFLATYKGNNTGEDLSQELYSFDDDYFRTTNISTISMPSAPGIDKRFYYFNRSHNATFNNVYRIGKSGEFGINAAYLNDRDTRQSQSSVANYLPDGDQNTVDERMKGTAYTQKAYGDLTYMNNGDENYLKEQLKFDWSITDADSRILADGDNISQIGKTNTYRLLNKFHMTHRNSSDRGFEITSLVNLEKRPHSLCVYPNLFSDIIPDDILYQHVDFRNISTENSAGLLSAFKVGNFTLHPSAIANYHHNSLESRLEASDNDLTLDYLDAGVGAEMMFSTRKVNASLYLPMKFQMFRLNNRLDGNITDKNRFSVEPSFNFTYKFNSNHNLKVAAMLNYMIPSIETLYSGHILTSYRQLSAYDVTGLFEGMNQHYSLGYDFKNVLSMSFAGAEISWNRQSPEVLYGSYYDGIVQRAISRRTSENGDMISAKIHIGQGFDWRRLKIGASIIYSYYDSPLLVQNEVLRYSGNSIGVNADISLTPFKWLGVAYQGNYSQSATRQKGYDRFPWLRTLTNKASLDFTIPEGVTLTTSLYHYYNNFNDGDKSFFLLNAEARYTIKRFSFRLSCDNLLNRKSYIYSNLSALTESKAIYNIRPLSVLLKIRFRIF
ncbi:MAG: Plug domain-containing protein [Muribaculaceae bacterium]|nr:Plug domain-containing protein [Muribaculaceae bacterium]